MILTPEEIEALTGRQRRNAQIRALRHMGIEHRVRPDGTLAVLRAHVEHTLSGTVYTPSKAEVEPDWGAM